ncbi:putative histidine kinase [Methanocella paludicola SANAE]|uniref:histidine kinase n=1 Tax=Methanocella paludicola (strain DSM 17711 / JCM 13418 / NBRC 101707 / SANAE) TaxID=304371 RepID=D1YUK2_METPS|nr:PAS domain S-box protein [Methanocella paludicola]BAI60124.1 putative histidine kinase [Methanocella paludicola SANAE]
MGLKSESGKKSGSTSIVDSGDKDRIIAELKARNKELEEYKARAERLEADLRNNEDTTRQLLEQKLYGVWVNVDGKIAYINEVGAKILGASSPGEVAGKSVLDEIIHPNYRDIVRDRIKAMSHGGSAVPMIEEKYVRVDGQVVDVDVWAMRFVYKGEPAIFVAFKDITERKRAEEALRESEEKYRFLVENSKDVIWKMDLQGRLTFISSNVERVTGYRPGEMVGKPIWDFIAPECHGSIKEKLLKRMRGEDIPPYATWIINKAGDLIPIEVATTAITDRGGRIVGVQGISRDITERKRAEEALRESERKFRVLTETSPVAIFLYQGEKYVYVNPMAEVLTGYSRDELLTMDAWDWIHPEFKFMVKERSRKRQLGKKVPNQYEVKYRARDGREGWVDFATGLIEYGGKPAGLAATFDVTKRKLAEEAVRTADVRFRSLIQNSSDIIRILDKEEHIIYESPSSEKILGYPPGYTLGKSPFEFIHPDDRERVRNDLGEVYEGTNPGTPTEFRIRKADGSYLEVESIGNNMIGIRGVDGIVITTRPITERKRAEKALKEAKAQAELYVDLMGHDINNMNQVSLGFLELAHNIIELEGKLGEDNIVLLDKAMNSLKDSSMLIESVRKIQQEKMGLYEPQVLDVGTVVGDAIKHFDRIPKRDIKINYSQDDHYFIKANSLLKDVFINLIGNAIKHSKGPLVINIRACQVIAKGKRYCRVEVEDNGSGIPDSLKATLFDRLNLAATRAKGKGFGLCLIKILVDDYHGMFWVEDRVKGDHAQGARFVVLLPAIEK